MVSPASVMALPRSHSGRQSCRLVSEVQGEIQDVAEAEQEGQPDHRPHDHGDSPNDCDELNRAALRRTELCRRHQLSPPGGSTGNAPSITNRPVRIPCSDRHPSACCPAQGSNLRGRACARLVRKVHWADSVQLPRRHGLAPAEFADALGFLQGDCATVGRMNTCPVQVCRVFVFDSPLGHSYDSLPST